MSKLKVDISILNNSLIESGDRLKLRINKNFQNFTNGTIGESNQPLIEKQFFVEGFQSVDRFLQVEDGNITSQIGTVNGVIESVEYFTYNNQDLIALAGNFIEYIYNGVTTQVNRLIILNPDGSIFQVPTIFNSSDTVSVVKYHELNQTLIVGGKFTGKGNISLSINYLLEYDIATNDYSANMTDWEQNGSIQNTAGANVKDIAIRQSNGSIYAVGKFEFVLGNDLNSVVRLHPDFTYPSDSTIDFNVQVETSVQGFINTVEVAQEGSEYVYLGGLFDYFDYSESSIVPARQNLIVLSAIISLRPDTTRRFESVDQEVEDISLDGDRNMYLITREKSNYGLNSGLKYIHKMNPSAIPLTFTDLQVTDRRGVRIEATNDDVYVSSTSNTTPGLFYIENYDVTGNLKSGFELNGPTKGVENIPGTNIFLIAGGFTEYKPDLTTLTEDQIVVGATDNDTAQNLYDNLNQYNVIPDGNFRYRKEFNTITLDYTIDNEEDIYYLSGIVEKTGVYEITETQNDSSLIDKIDIAPLRSDVITFGKSNTNTTNTKFEIGDLQDIIDNNLENNITVIKQRVSENIQNSYLNLTKLIPNKNLRPNLEYFLGLDRNFSAATVKNSGHGKFISTKNTIRNRDVDLQTDTQIYYVLAGYRFDLGVANDKVFLNGNKRMVVRNGTIAIPFLSYQVENISIESNSNTIFLGDGDYELTDPTKPGEFVSYLLLNTGSYFDGSRNINIRFTLKSEFLNTGEPNETNVRIDIDDTGTLYNPTRVIFKNSYGLLEELYFNGKIIDKINTDKKEYKKSIYSTINSGTKYNHLRTEYNKTPSREWDVNTGNTYDYMNKAYEDLVTSEEVWIEVEGKVIPVNIQNSNFQPLLDKADGVINYTFTFEEAADINQKLLS